MERDFLQGIGLHDCGVKLGRSEIYWSSWQEGQPGSQERGTTAVYRQNVFIFLKEASDSF